MKANSVRQLEYVPTAASRTANEWALVKQAVAGNAVVLELLLAQNLRKLYRTAFTILRNREDAEDALQEGMCKAFRRLPSFEGRSSLSTWLTRIVMNAALMSLRRRRSHPESSLDEMIDDEKESPVRVVADARPNPEQICAVVEFNELVEQRLMRLPASEQAVFRYYAINGHSTMESSLMFGITSTALKSRIRRTRRRLANGLQHSPGKSRTPSSKGNSTHGTQR